MITRESTDDPTLRRVIASVEGLSESEILSVLSLALVVHALDHCMNDGTMGTAEVKDLVNTLTNGMIDIWTTEPSSPFARD